MPAPASVEWQRMVAEQANTKELLRLVSKFREFLTEERDHLLESFCALNPADRTPIRSTLEPHFGVHVDRLEALLKEIDAVLEKYETD